jgi:hypothetical protein
MIEDSFKIVIIIFLENQAGRRLVNFPSGLVKVSHDRENIFIIGERNKIPIG